MNELIAAGGYPVPLELPVRFAETDAMGIVHHSNYLIWFEAVRIAWLDAVGAPYAEVAAGGHHFAVTSACVEYRAPARFGDVVRVTGSVAEVRSRKVSFRYVIHNVATGVLIATGSTEHICVDLQGRMAKIPEWVHARMEAILSAQQGAYESACVY